MMTRFKIGRVALLSGCAFAGIIVPAHAQTAATATTESQRVEDADPSTRDIVVTGTQSGGTAPDGCEYRAVDFAELTVTQVIV